MTHLVSDAFATALDMAKGLASNGGLKGYGIVELFRDVDPERPRELWQPDLVLPFANLITDAGDLYAAAKVITGISPANPSAPTAMSGMKLGTGSTAVAKSGAGAALVTYKTGSNVAFDASFPATNNLGGGLGVEARYKGTWAAGVATDPALAEAVICNDAGTNATSSAANTGSRTVFGSTINKGALDALSITWAWKYLGA